MTEEVAERAGDEWLNRLAAAAEGLEGSVSPEVMAALLR
ncbi:hypothetical protein P3T27_001569 [Kitasatospora sp. MAA19]|nr:hypothetical protein [Kitasatospora sp. MAA19]